MTTKIIKIANKEVTLAYCYATEIAFQRYTGTGLENFDATNSEHVVYLVLSAVLAYNEAMKKAPEDAPIKDTDLMYEAKPADLVLALATVFELRKQWYEVPDGDTAEKAEEEEDKEKKLTSTYDIYQLLVGEIGIDRHVFLYDLQFWEARRIVKGYRRRDILKYQLLRLCAYMSCFSMRDAEGKKPEDWLPLSFDKEDIENAPPIEQKDIDDLQALMASINKTKK